MQRHDDELRLREIGRAVADWALGLGLLRVHLAVFTVGTVALVMTDLYRSPGDLRTDGSLRLWAVVLGCHTAALLAGWATWRAVRPHRLVNPIAPAATVVAPATRPDAAAVGWSVTGPGRNGRTPTAPAETVSTPVNGAAAPAPVAATRRGAPPAIAPLPSRGRFSPSPSAPPIVGHGALPHLHAGEATAKLRTAATDAAAVGRSSWQRLAGATRSRTVSLRDRLTRSGGEPPEAIAAGSAGGPPPGWPPPPVATGSPPGWEGVIAPATPPAGTNGAAAPAGAAGWPPPPGHHGPPSITAPQPTRPGTPPLQAETEWTWMEAAAASWLARRDAEVDQPPAGSSARASADPASEASAAGDTGVTEAPR